MYVFACIFVMVESFVLVPISPFLLSNAVAGTKSPPPARMHVHRRKEQRDCRAGTEGSQATHPTVVFAAVSPRPFLSVYYNALTLSSIFFFLL